MNTNCSPARRPALSGFAIAPRLGLFCLAVLGPATLVHAKVDVSVVATVAGSAVVGMITLTNTQATPASVTSLWNTLEVRFDVADGVVVPGLPIGSETGFYRVATTFPAFPATLAGNGTATIPFRIDTCGGSVAAYSGTGFPVDDIRSVAVVRSPTGTEADKSDTSTAPNQYSCPVCGNGVREAAEQCDGGTCCTAACGFAANGSSCSDGNACTQTDQCQIGTCTGSSPVTCSALDQCHVAGTCNPGTGACSHPVAANGVACNDGSACSINDACFGGSCDGAPMNCNDANACTSDSCAAGACVHSNTMAPCDDGNICTTGDTCGSGQCLGGGATDCNDSQACTDDVCVVGAGCTHAATPVCDTCQAGDCTTCRAGCTAAGNQCGQNCLEGFFACLNGCTTQTYCAPFCQVDYGGCLNTCPISTTACNAACDAGNGCAAGCTPPQPDADGDGIGDTLDNCSTTPNAGQADLDADGIGDACDDQSCGNGSVEGREACDGGSCCTAQCAVAANGAACNDANACTSTDQCQAGACVGGNPVVCGAPDSCHAAGACNVATGVCTNPARPDGTACDDDDPCSIGDACAAGRCVAEPMNCDDGDGCTDDGCAGGACLHTDNAASCDDGNVCTTSDVCGGGQCGSGLAVDCDDGNGCTVDTCASASGCAYDPIAGCPCDAAACGTCRDQCGPGSATCSEDCWTAFTGCLDGCSTQTYCAPFCQVDLGACLQSCAAQAACESACDASHGCGSGCAAFGTCPGPTQSTQVHGADVDDSLSVVLFLIDPNPPSLVTGYNLYRSSSPVGPFILVGENLRDFEAETPNVQLVDVDSGWCEPLCFYKATAFNGVCGMEGPQ